MSESPSSAPRELKLKSSSTSTSPRKSPNGAPEMDGAESTPAAVAHLVEQLHAHMSSPLEKEAITARLLGITRARKDVRTLIGSHAQAIPLLISILRGGNPAAKANVAATLSLLCINEDLKMKVILGGCIPPLLLLLKSNSVEVKKAAAEAIYEMSSGRVSDDHVASKIFSTEGVVPVLWDQLVFINMLDKQVVGFVSGALRNLCGEEYEYWRATLVNGGIDILVALLSSDNAASQSNAATLLGRLMLACPDSIPKLIDCGTVKALLQLLGHENDISVRSSAAEALEALSSETTMAMQAVVDADGVPALIEAVVAPSKECMREECGLALPERATKALANMCGGMSALIMYLGELSQSPYLVTPLSDIVGALAYTLMVFEQKSGIDAPYGETATRIEDVLVLLLKTQDNELVQESVLEALDSLYSNIYLSKWLREAEAKKVLIGLIISAAAADVQEYLILSFTNLCCQRLDIWEAIGKRDGTQLLISLFGLSSEQHQQYAVQLLAILTDQVDDSMWAITAAGGIPPLVQLLESGSQKAGEDATHILLNLCSHSEDIRACVESARAVPVLLWRLKSGGPDAQEVSTIALTKLVQTADSATINQLLALLRGTSPSSKANVIRVLSHVLIMAPHMDLVTTGVPANKALTSLVQLLHSSNEKTQEYAASVLADLFSSREDICDILATDIVHPCLKLLKSNAQVVAMQSARVLGALSHRPLMEAINKMPYIEEGVVKPLINIVHTSFIHAAETAATALANLLSDPQIAAEALDEDILSALTRILGEGTTEGKRKALRALHVLLNHFPVDHVLTGNSQSKQTVLSLVDSLNALDMDGCDVVLSLLDRTKRSLKFTCFPWSALAEVPSSLEPLVRCLAKGPPSFQDKTIKFLSGLCGINPVVLGDLLIVRSRSIASLSSRIVNSSSSEVRIGGTALLICATIGHRQQAMDSLDLSGYLKPLIFALVEMINPKSSCGFLEIELISPRSFLERSVFQEGNEFVVSNPATVLGGTAAMWLLSILSSFHVENKITVLESGGVEALCDKLTSYSSSPKAEFEDTEGRWISAMLLAILFQGANVVSSPVTIRIVPSLAFLLSTDEVIDRFFATQAVASLACKGVKEINLAIANSGAVAGLFTMTCYTESDFPNLVALSEYFSLPQKPDQVVLENLLKIEDVIIGSAALTTITLIVDLLWSVPEKPDVPTIVLHFLTNFAIGSDANTLIMAEAGALEALTKYLSLNPPDIAQATVCELLRILFRNPKICYEALLNSLNQLIVVLGLRSEDARHSAVRALNELFNVENIRDSELARQAIHPLINMLDSATSECEERAALVALIKLTSGNHTNAAALMNDVGGNPLESLHRILSSSSSLELKSDAAQLCTVFFSTSKGRTNPIASQFMEPLILLMQSDSNTALESSVCAIDKLLRDQKQVELAAAYDVINILVSLVSGSNHRLAEASISALIKLGKDHTPHKLDMVKEGIIDNCLELVPIAPSSLCSSIAELFLILTNSNAIAKSSVAAGIVEPLFTVLLRCDISMWGQHSALQALVNIFEKLQNIETSKLTPSQVIDPLISRLESPSQAIQQLASELLSHIVAQKHFQQDISIKNAVVPLVHLAGSCILTLQKTAIKALETVSTSWPKAVADASCISQLAKLIIQDNPQPPHALWESAASIISNVLHFDSEYYTTVPLVVLVKMLHSTVTSTITVTLSALTARVSSDVSCVESMAEAGAIDAFLHLLRSHQCEEESGKLLEALFYDVRVQEMKISKYAIASLSQYLLDPQSKSYSTKLCVAKALAQLSQHEGLAKVHDSPTACHAMINLLENQPTEEMILVAIGALQYLVMQSRTNRRAVAEARGISLVQELLFFPSSNVSGQAALLIKYLFSNRSLQEYVSSELIGFLTARLEAELKSTENITEVILNTLNVIFANFPKLHASGAATLCVPNLVGALKSGSAAAQESALNTLCLLKHSWSSMSTGMAKSQAMVAAEAIPILQVLMNTRPLLSFHEKAESLLYCLPGCLTVTVMRGNNLKQTMGNTNAFCQLSIGNGPPQRTKVVNHSTSPEWNQRFKWVFNAPPRGQQIEIVCKSKNAFGKATLGRLIIHTDKVVTEGVCSGIFNLNRDSDSNRDTSPRTIEILVVWSHGRH